MISHALNGGGEVGGEKVPAIVKLLGGSRVPQLLLAEEEFFILKSIFCLVCTAVPTESLGEGGQCLCEVSALPDDHITPWPQYPVHFQHHQLHLTPAHYPNPYPLSKPIYAYV